MQLKAVVGTQSKYKTRKVFEIIYVGGQEQTHVKSIHFGKTP